MIDTNAFRSLRFFSISCLSFTLGLGSHVTLTNMYVVHCETVYLLHLVYVSYNEEANALPSRKNIRSTFIDLSSYNPEEYSSRTWLAVKGDFVSNSATKCENVCHPPPLLLPFEKKINCWDTADFDEVPETINQSFASLNQFIENLF